MAYSRLVWLAATLIGVVLFNGCTSAVDLSDEPDVLTLTSSDSLLVARFEWAASTARAYVRQGDPVGPWYEASLPGRDAFCMRDVSHQALGAHLLGLSDVTRNMLYKFAAAVSDERDWCSYWEIDRLDRPAPVDYRDDDAFWYNLPANFDVLDASWRMFQWTGDSTYVRDPAFLNFYRKTVHDFVDRWALGPFEVFDRPRYMNRASFDMDDPYQWARGIPSYHEGQPGDTQVGIDLLAFHAKGLRSYAAIMSAIGDEREPTWALARADSVADLVDRFWDEDAERFWTIFQTDGSFSNGGGLRAYLLYTDVVRRPERIAATVTDLVHGPSPNIEIRSQHPEVLYRYGATEAAYQEILTLGAPEMPRREYPEVSFALIGAIAQGMMGIEPIPGGVASRPRLSEMTDWAELKGVGVGNFLVNIRHEGQTRSTLVNRSVETISWRAEFGFSAREILADGRPLAIETTLTRTGQMLSAATLDVPPGRRITVEAERDQP